MIAAPSSITRNVIPIPADVQALPVSRQRKQQIARSRLGLCQSCAKPRGVYKGLCDVCRKRKADSSGILVMKKQRKADFVARLSALQPEQFIWLDAGEWPTIPATQRRMLNCIKPGVFARHEHGDRTLIVRVS